jgi:hypothetical protein
MSAAGSAKIAARPTTHSHDMRTNGTWTSSRSGSLAAYRTSRGPTYGLVHQVPTAVNVAVPE